MELLVAQAVAAAVFMFGLNLFQIFGQRNDILFCPVFVLQSDISNAICKQVLQLFSDGKNIFK